VKTNNTSFLREQYKFSLISAITLHKLVLYLVSLLALAIIGSFAVGVYQSLQGAVLVVILYLALGKLLKDTRRCREQMNRLKEAYSWEFSDEEDAATLTCFLAGGHVPHFLNPVQQPSVDSTIG
jgi:hypothetical protein